MKKGGIFGSSTEIRIPVPKSLAAVSKQAKEAGFEDTLILRIAKMVASNIKDIESQPRVFRACLKAIRDPEQGTLFKTNKSTTIKESSLKVRVGDYRILYRITEHGVMIDKIGHRKEVYGKGSLRN